MIALVGRGIASLAGRMATRNPRLGKKIFDLLKKPKGITVYRGEPWKSKDTLQEMANMMYGSGRIGVLKNLGKTVPSNATNPLRQAAAGRWFTDEPRWASRFAGYSGLGNWGRIKSVTLSPKELKLAKKLSRKIHEGSGRLGPSSAMVVPKSALARAKTDHLQTLINNFYKNLGIYRGKDGGLARILNV